MAKEKRRSPNDFNGQVLAGRQLAYILERINNPQKTHRDCAEAAGYAPGGPASRNASRLEKDPRVKEILKKAGARAIEKAQINLEKIVEELATMGFARMGDYMEFLENGDVRVDWSKLTPKQAAAIQEVTIDEYMDGKGEDARQMRRIKFKLHDKRSALVDIAKLMGLEPPKQVNGDMTIRVIQDED